MPPKISSSSKTSSSYAGPSKLPTPPERDHIVVITPEETALLKKWLEQPANGALVLSHRGVSFCAVQGGGITIRTVPYSRRGLPPA